MCPDLVLVLAVGLDLLEVIFLGHDGSALGLSGGGRSAFLRGVVDLVFFRLFGVFVGVFLFLVEFGLFFIVIGLELPALVARS